MTKRTINFLIMILLFNACTDNKSIEDKNKNDKPLPKEIHTHLYGTYTGMFVTDYDSMKVIEDVDDAVKISVEITLITNEKAEGRSIVKGLSRPMAGSIKVSGDTTFFDMKEPGDHPHDGLFKFYIVKDSLVGNWQANDKKIRVPYKKMTLHKQAFVYNPNNMLISEWDYIDFENPRNETELYEQEDGKIDTFINQVYRAASERVYTINASTQQLNEQTLKDMRKLDLEILRNTIFARHGYSFKKRAVRQFFDQVEWYMPLFDNVDDKITPLEKQNIALLQKFEQYAEDNYDTFGR